MSAQPKVYYGTKRVEAWPETKSAWPDAIGGSEGYAVKYADGYTSWSPKAVFEAVYQPLDALSFGHALEVLNAGKKVRRGISEWKTWSLKKERAELLLLFEDSGEIEVFEPNGDELFANDWQVVE